jgi:hypothetical protein
MAKKREVQSVKAQRPKRAKLSAKESLKRVQEFHLRKEAFVAAVRKGAHRGVSA